MNQGYEALLCKLLNDCSALACAILPPRFQAQSAMPKWFAELAVLCRWLIESHKMIFAVACNGPKRAIFTKLDRRRGLQVFKLRSILGKILFNLFIIGVYIALGQGN
jgi:hypothetical protein